MLAVTKQKLNRVQVSIGALRARNERVFLLAVRQWFILVYKQLWKDLTAKFLKDVMTELTDWELLEEKGVGIVRPVVLKIMGTGGQQAYQHLSIVGSFDVLNIDAIQAANKFCAKLVKEVTNVTKQGIRTYISTGIREGKSMPKIARELRSLVGLTETQTQTIAAYRIQLEDKTKFPKLTDRAIDKKVQHQYEVAHRLRMESIARTETARAQNIGYCKGLEENDVARVRFLIAPTDACEICIGMDGNQYSTKEGKDIIPVHPRCRCTMIPIVEGKSR